MIRIGTRGSDLALWQARHVAARLGAAGEACELVVLVTGSVTLTIGTDRGPQSHALTTPGESVAITEGQHVDYQLGGSHSSIVVLCDQPFAERR